MKERLISTLLTACCLSVLSCTEEKNLCGYVDTSIGSGGHGHVFVGANVPFGAVQLGPTSIPQEWDWCSGYNVRDSSVIGFSHTHLSGTGIGDLFDITVMPVTGEGVEGGLGNLRYSRGETADPQSGLWSPADRNAEISVPGYYSVPLTRYGIRAEMTATCRVGFHRYTFPASEEAALVFDLENGGCWDMTTGCSLEAGEDHRTLEGYRYSTGWAKDQKIWFHAEFSRPFDDFEIIRKELGGKPLPLYGRADFRTEEGEQILLKVAVSPHSIEAARKNMEAELPGWDFNTTAALADKAWGKELSKIRIETKDEDIRKIFYTALYHTMIAPSAFCDYGGPARYTTLSLWDTYRAAMPLFMIIHPEKVNDLIRTMLEIHERQGKLPVWHLMGCETDCMVGNPGIPVVADAILKGYDGFDRESAYEAMKESAMKKERGQGLRMEYGYIPCDLFNESVAYDLEYALADWSIAQVAQLLAEETGKEEYRNDYRHFMERSRSYKHLFDPEKGFIRGKDSKGQFRKEYSPFSSVHRQDDYCEGNGWQYTWLVPHDPEGLAACFGSREKMIRKLDSLFLVPSRIEGETHSVDITGLIGQYAHGNEPSHHILYFYSRLGQGWKTAELVRKVMDEMYTTRKDGLIGNEDAGQMSAWYILSAMGFYQAEPAGGRYWFGSPVIDKAEIQVQGGTFTVIAENNSEKNRYIGSVTLNGQPCTKGYIDFKEMTPGGRLVFRMTDQRTD